MTSQDEITRTADRLKDAFGAAADVMAADDSPVRVRGPKIGRAWRWLLPLTAAASVAVIVLAEVFIGHHPARNTSAGGPFTQIYSGIGKARLANVPAPNPAVMSTSGYQADRSRVVKVTGFAPSCGLLIEGSGFVYAPDHVLTNAHVVAGVTEEGRGSGIRGPVVTTSGAPPSEHRWSSSTRRWTSPCFTCPA